MSSTFPPDATAPKAWPRRWSRRRLGCLALLLLPLLLIANEWLIRPLLNPLRRSPDAITADLLQKTPIGTSRSEVEAWVISQGWGYGGIVGDSRGQSPIYRSLGSYETYAFLINVFAE